MAKLVVKKGRNIGADYKLNADRLIMGRRSACPIPVLDPKSSREHAMITRKGEQFFIHDLGRNGTFVNEAPISKSEQAPTALKYGDRIKIGDTVMEVVDEKNEPVGIEIPGYKILEKIGEGGMGTVYKAKQLSMDRVVALKVLNEKYSSNREFVDRFIREARAAGKLNHPNVIHVHDVSKANTRHYFSMEYVDGNSVRELLRIQRKLPLEQALDIGIQTAKALEFAHENQIVHRDIKPDNIMVTKDGVVKIADLGIAKSFDENKGLSKSPQKVMGTPHYMAPEQALGKEIDHRADIYSLGATLYHILSGTTPFTGNTAHEVLKAHIQESLAPIQEYTPEAPDSVCFIVERMMAKLPEKRYANMTRLIEDLERAQQGVEEGIERIPAGDSTIMRAVGAEKAAKRKKKEATEDVGTGVQEPINPMLLYAGLALLFVAVVLAVVVFFRPPAEDAAIPPEPPALPGTGPGNEKKAGDPTDPQAEKKLADARMLLNADPVSPEAERLLKEVESTYPTLKACEEARQGLKAIAAGRQEAEKRKAQGALDAARAFETANQGDPQKMGEIAQRFRAALAQAAKVPEIADAARQRAEHWEAQQKAEAARNVDAALKMALGDAEAALRQKDYDAARRPLQDFLGKFGAAPQKSDAETKLKAVSEEADQLFAAAKTDAERAEKDPAHPIPALLAVWENYLKNIKDGVHRGEADQALKAVQARAEKFIQTEGAKIADQVKRYDYDPAILAARQMASRLAGSPYVESVKGRDKELEQQRALHAKVLEAITTRCQTGQVLLPFPYDDPKWKDVKQWAVSGASGDKLNLDAVPKNAAPGVSRKFADFGAPEQYELYKCFLANPTQDDHRALAAFCKERGLAAEANLHASKASGAP